MCPVLKNGELLTREVATSSSLSTIHWAACYGYGSPARQGTTSHFIAFGVAMSGTGNAYIAGYTDGNLGAPSAGGFDIFLAKYGTPPCPAVFNQHGVVDFFDYLDFVDALSLLIPVADFNVDGMIDFFDYLDFVDAFSVRC